MSPLIQQILGAIVRTAIVWLAAKFGAQISDEQALQLAAQIVPILIVLGWSVYQKYKNRVVLLTALEMPAGTSEQKVHSEIKAGMGAALSVLLIVVALSATSCASMGGAKHQATVSVVTAHAVLSAVQDGERLLVCGAATAPAAPACVPPEVHRQIAGELVTAFDLDGQVLRLVRAMPPGTITLTDIPPLLNQISVLIDRIFALIPASPHKAALAAQIGGGK